MIYGIHDNPHLPDETRQELAKLRAAQGTPGPGLGDLVAAATTAVGIKPCGQCKRNQAALNRATPNWLRRGLAALGLAHGQPDHHEQKRPDQEDSAATGPEVHK